MTETVGVDKGFVDRNAFDQGGGLVEDLIDRSARFGIGFHSSRHYDDLRTVALCLRGIHRRSDAEGLGFVAAGQHHPGTDDYGFAPQLRIVTLLDRRVEGVEVSVED